MEILQNCFNKGIYNKTATERKLKYFLIEDFPENSCPLKIL